MKSTKRGRPRGFCKDAALENALKVFLEKGYEGASLDDLTSAMGINKPSMYAAFGNKEELFFEVLKFYSEPNFKSIKEILFSLPTAREAFKALLNGIVQGFIDKRCSETMDGCLVVNSTILSCREENLSEKLKILHTRNEELFYKRLKLGQEQGEFSPDQDMRELAQFFNGVFQGMAVSARSQQSEQALKSIASIAIKVLDCVSPKVESRKID